MVVGVGVGPALEQGADEAFGLAVGLGPVGPCLLDGDLVGVAGSAQRRLKQLPLSVSTRSTVMPCEAVEADELVEEGER